MKVEVLARFPRKKSKTEEEMEEDRIQELIGRKSESKEVIAVQYVYTPMILDLKNISEIIQFDEKLTELTMEGGDTYLVKVDYENFKEVYQQYTGSYISTIKYVEETIPKVRLKEDVLK